MKMNCISAKYDEEEKSILPLLRGHVFHVTSACNLPGIIEAGIVPYRDGKFESPFGSNGFFKSRDCVSFFDFRSDDAEEKVQGCYPLGQMKEYAVLYLSPAFHRLLID